MTATASQPIKEVEGGWKDKAVEVALEGEEKEVQAMKELKKETKQEKENMKEQEEKEKELQEQKQEVSDIKERASMEAREEMPARGRRFELKRASPRRVCTEASFFVFPSASVDADVMFVE